MSIVELTCDPEAANSLPFSEIPAALCRLSSFQTVLLARLIAEAPSAQGDKNTGEELLTIDDACRILKIRPDYLYRHWKKIPGSMKIAGKIRFNASGLRRWTENQRAR